MICKSNVIISSLLTWLLNLPQTVLPLVTDSKVELLSLVLPQQLELSIIINQIQPQQEQQQTSKNCMLMLQINKKTPLQRNLKIIGRLIVSSKLQLQLCFSLIRPDSKDQIQHPLLSQLANSKNSLLLVALTFLNITLVNKQVLVHMQQ